MTYRARSRGASIIEVPITFKDRQRGESKMSKAIVVEALALVTKWAAERGYRAAKSGLHTVKRRRG
jgi:dolichol-phosphate mannosyltransferase